ncbi:GFA family protein [Devosia ginsengisoli]|uniref:CENP-V/GFA domain-containing protein n=1 Tax=Devosia ginsengisoli TaxID=400770 RepID=A0A5B8LMN2_9HYPH|nr:DUF6151 family protein [Devosia ginsengisoli]QDZ09383.1 hypothetical protein FPZ08_00650 [Devosia ginsengisoli]
MKDKQVMARCSCGQVEIEAWGKPIASVICHCDDCQAAGRALGALPDAPPLLDTAGGTGNVLYRKDRVQVSKGGHLLEAHKLTPDTKTSRMVATCCNAPMAITFDDARHWVPLYRDRLEGAVPPVQWRICTKFRPPGVELPDDVPAYAMYPFGMMAGLALSAVAMLVAR